MDQPKDGIFAAFGDARWKIENGIVNMGRELYFALYQSLAEDERRAGLFKSFPPDFFDLIIVDECHRGSARDASSWRVILEHFEPAFQLGMTATPLREDNRDTYLYFGNMLYEYSRRRGEKHDIPCFQPALRRLVPSQPSQRMGRSHCLHLLA